MKALVLIAALFGAGVAAAAPCKEGSKSYIVTEDNNGRQFSELRTCTNGTYMTAEEKAAYIYNPRTSCVEGSKSWIVTEDVNGRQFKDLRTCKNGTYMTAAEKAAYVYVPKNRCKEGRIEPGTQFDDVSGKGYPVTRQCQNGKWVIIRN